MTIAVIIYLDESYDNPTNRYLLLGALFIPNQKGLRRAITDARHDANYRNSDGTWREIKYANCYREEDHRVASAVVDRFMAHEAWFRCIVVERSRMDLNRFGKASEATSLKQARAYKKFCEFLIGHNTADIRNGVLLADRMTRCRGDHFVQAMGEALCQPGTVWYDGEGAPRLRHVQEVDSKVEQYAPLQLCDLLTGSVLNGLVPTVNPWKNAIRRYVLEQIGVPDFSYATWRSLPKSKAHKFGVWHWRPRT